jgi:hypothetical protein
MTTANFINPSGTGLTDYIFTSGLLEAWYGAGLTDLVIGDTFSSGTSGSSGLQYSFLEYIKCPASTGYAGLPLGCLECMNLAKVDYYTSLPNTTTQSNAFSGCNALQELHFPSDMINVTSYSNTFNSCFSLYSVTLPASMNFVTTINFFFSNCRGLKEVQIPNLPSLEFANSAFLNCVSLIELNIPGLRTTSGDLNLTGFADGCRGLQNINLPAIATGVIVNFNTAFRNCTSLIRIDIPTNIDVSDFSRTFEGCRSLLSLVLPTNAPSCSNLVGAFKDCNNLQSVTLPTTIGGTPAVNTNETFSGTRALLDVVIPSSYLLFNVSNMFLDSSVRSITLPNNAQDTVTTFATFASGCTNLETVVLPTSVNSVTTFANAFLNCHLLQSVTLPASMSLCTTFSNTFDGCRSLTSVTFPTALPSAGTTAFASCFRFCYSLTEVTLPATVNTNLNSFGATFLLCRNLKTVTLPTTQTTSLTATGLASMFEGCTSLKTVNNLNKIGNNAAGSTIYTSAEAMFGTISQGKTFLLESVDMTCKFSKFVLAGNASQFRSVSSLRLRNAGSGQYAGSSPHIDIKYTNLGQAALVQVFNDIPTVSGKTIDITDAVGAAALTAGERAIATGKGWTIIG